MHEGRVLINKINRKEEDSEKCRFVNYCVNEKFDK